MADITLSPAGRFVEELSAHALALDGTPYSTARAKGTTPAGNVLVSDDQPEGVLVLASGHAFAEALPPSQSKLSKGSEVGGSFTFGGTSAGSRPVDGKAVARWRVGVGDHLRIGGGVFGAAPGSGRLYAASKCEWIFYPADPLGNGSPPLGPDGRNPLIRFLRERRYIEDLGVVLRLRRLPLLSRVDFDAVRFLLTFFEVVRYKPGDPVLAALDPVRPISVLDGRIGGPSGSYGPGSFLFADQLSPNPSPGPPPPAGAEYVALDRTVTLEIRDPLVPLLQDHDPRIGAAWDARWERPWQAIIGDVGEAAPDAQTLALNLAAAEATEPAAGAMLPSGMPIVVIDPDGKQLLSRATGFATRIAYAPAFAPGWMPPKAFGNNIHAGVIGLDASSVNTLDKVMTRVAEIDAWMATTEFRKLIFRLPRAVRPLWMPVLDRAGPLAIVADDPLDVVPPGISALRDAARILRLPPGKVPTTVARLPMFSLSVGEAAAGVFWDTGRPMGTS